MKKVSYKLILDNPCTQEWNSMTENSCGRFCSNCSKSVIDLSNMNDSELINFAENNSGKFCGRVKATQLNRTIIKSIQEPKKGFSYKLLASIFLLNPSQGSSVSNNNVISELVSVSGNDQSADLKIEIKEEGKGGSDTSLKVISGVVIDSVTCEGLPFVSVIIKDTKTGTLTDIDGKFKLVIPENLLNDEINLSFLSLGYSSITITVANRSTTLKQEIILCQDEVRYLGGAFFYKAPKRWWRFWK